MAHAKLFWRAGGLGVVALLASATIACSKGPGAGQAGSGARARSVAELVGDADGLYRNRHDLLNVRKSIVLLREVRNSDAKNYEAAWKLARAGYYLGTHSSDSSEQDQAFRDGAEAGEAAAALADDKPEGHFWYGANLAGRARLSQLSSLAFSSEIRRRMERVIAIEEGFLDGSAYMVLGQLELERPGMMGGSPAKAVATLERGLRFGQRNPVLRLRLAEACLAANKRPAAKAQLDAILALAPSADYVPEQEEAREAAKRLVEKHFAGKL